MTTTATTSTALGATRNGASPEATSRGRLQAITDAGRRLAETADDLARSFALTAGESDRAGTFPIANVEALREAGYFAAAVPEELGGLGVESAHDLLVASVRLAEGDPAIAIGANMHTNVVYSIGRRWRAMEAEGDPLAPLVGGFLTSLVSDGHVIATPVSERNQDLTMPRTTALSGPDGWTVNGDKIFGTMSPGATLLLSAVTFEQDGEPNCGFILVPRGAPGVTLHDDWDALGMRASGSGSVSYKDVEVPAVSMISTFAHGKLSTSWLNGYILSGPLHGAASLGIAEVANRLALEGLARPAATPRGETALDRGTTKVLAGENAIDLAAARGALERAGRCVDEYFAPGRTERGGYEAAEAAFAESQAAKAVIGRAAQRIVDRALTLSGGAGFMSRHPLARCYRDVRAVGFMHPLAENVLAEYVGGVSLGLRPGWF